MQRQMVLTGAPSVDLDMRDVDPALFPNVVTALRQAGIDPERELIPVAPAAHYMMGGIATDIHARATLAGLHAVGECSCTGLHGANRLASNSLTECFVFGARAARSAVAEPGPRPAAAEAAATRRTSPSAPPPRRSRAPAARRCGAYAGLERDGPGLSELAGDPHPLVRLIAAVRARPHREPRRPSAHATSPSATRRFDGGHVTIGADRKPVLQNWDRATRPVQGRGRPLRTG